LKAVKRDRVVWIFFGVLFAAVSIWNIDRYIHYDRIIESEPPVAYSFVDKLIKARARGDYYQMRVMFERKQFTVDIAGKVYRAIDQNIFPDLYYSRDRGVVFSIWEKVRAGRLAVLFFALALVVMYPCVRVRRGP
jgi:hypothetical protein